MDATLLCGLSPFVRTVGVSHRHKNFFPYRRTVEISNTYIYISGGRGVHLVNGAAYPLCRGVVEIIPPFSDQTIIVNEGDTLDILYIYFDLFETLESRKIIVCGDYKETVRKTSDRELLFMNGDCYGVTSEEEQVRRCFSVLNGLREEKGIGSGLLRKAAMLELLAVFLESDKQPSVRDTGEKVHWDHITHALHFMETNYHNPSVDNQAIGAFVGVSAAYLSRLFQDKFNISLSAYLRGLRMEHAKELLGEGGRITDVAASCGYQSIQSFTRAFKQAEGISPSQFRERSFEKAPG